MRKKTLKKKTKKKNFLLKLIVTIFFLCIVVGSTHYFQLFPQLNQDKPEKIVADALFGWKYPVVKFPKTGPKKEIAYSDIRDPGGIPQGLPVRLKIPIIGVNSVIEDALITPDGRMDVPSGSVDVAWFSLGPHPGQVGSAVIGGHFGINNGVKFVFYDLDKLKIGDKVYIEDDKGDTLAFQVSSLKLFDRDADATTVFTSEDGTAHLNLITCEGTWNQSNGTYPQRRVVFTDSIPSEGAVVVKPHTPIAAKRAPIAKVIQTPQPTEQQPLVETPALTEKTETPSNEINSPASPQILIASAKSLYATPIDGIITSILFISIVFMAFKIIRR